MNKTNKNIQLLPRVINKDANGSLKRIMLEKQTNTRSLPSKKQF